MNKVLLLLATFISINSFASEKKFSCDFMLAEGLSTDPSTLEDTGKLTVSLLQSDQIRLTLAKTSVRVKMEEYVEDSMIVTVWISKSTERLSKKNFEAYISGTVKLEANYFILESQIKDTVYSLECSAKEEGMHEIL